MCTLSAIPGRLLTDSTVSLRVVFNRDELRTRPPAEPPRVVSIGNRQVLMPIDPAGGGTWIAVSDAGLVFTLLNVTSARAPGDVAAPARAMPRSRGTVIPAVANAATLDEVRARISSLPLAELSPFRLVVLDGTDVLEARWSGARLRAQLRALTGPWLRTSSSLGDARVVATRGALFAHTVSARDATAPRQDAFHHHRWLDRPEVSVLMARRDARTVSVTTIEIEARVARMRYEPVGEPRVPAIEAHLRLATG